MACGEHRHRHSEQGPGEEQRDNAGDQAQQSAFRQQLPDNAPPAGAKREAQAQFALAGGSTRELQAGDIGAGDDQHHSDGDHDEQNGEFQSAVQLAGKGRARPDERGNGFAQLGVRVVQGAEVVGEGGHLRLRLADADAGSEAGKEPAALVFAIAEPVAVGMNQRHQAERKPEIRRGHAGAYEVVRRDADDGEGDGH